MVAVIILVAVVGVLALLFRMNPKRLTVRFMRLFELSAEARSGEAEPPEQLKALPEAEQKALPESSG